MEKKSGGCGGDCCVIDKLVSVGGRRTTVSKGEEEEGEWREGRETKGRVKGRVVYDYHYTIPPPPPPQHTLTSTVCCPLTAPIIFLVSFEMILKPYSQLWKVK